MTYPYVGAAILEGARPPTTIVVPPAPSRPLRKRATWKELCRAGQHSWKAKEHAGGCRAEVGSHLHVRCRRCPLWWLEPMLFDPRPWTAAA